MKYIIQKRPGKVSVRHHIRHLEDGNTNVVDHSRSRPTSRRGVRETIGRIPLKDLTYPQAKKRFPFLNPNGNIDGDNKVNKKDCRPFDSMRQDEDLDYLTEQELNEAERRETSSALQQSENHFDIDEPIDDTKEDAKWKSSDEERELYNRAYDKNGNYTNDITKEEREALDRGFLTVKQMKAHQRLEAEDRARKASPKGDYDGDGVCNADDCHPLDPTKQDFDMYAITDKRKRELNKAYKERPSKFLQNQLDELKREEMERDIRNKQLVGREILKDRFGGWD
jgi:hypothetical protein